MAIIGMDIHRAFAEVVALEGKSRRRLGRIAMRCDRLAAFAAGLRKDDIVVVEATGNATTVPEVLAPHVGRVVIGEPETGSHDRACQDQNRERTSHRRQELSDGAALCPCVVMRDPGSRGEGKRHVAA